MGNKDFVAEDLDYYEYQDVLRKSCITIRDALQRQPGIFDGDEWVDSFLRRIKEAIRQREKKEPLRDINTVERIRPAPHSILEFVLVLKNLKPSAEQLAGTFQIGCSHSFELSLSI